MQGLVLGAIFGVVVVAPTPKDIDKTVQRVLDASYQTELPGFEAAGEQAGSPPAQRPRELRPGARQPHSRYHELRPSGAFGSIANALLWLLVAVITVVLLMWVVQEFRGYAGDAQVDGEAGPDRDERAARMAVLARPLGDAEALAAEGQFDAAIHTLLLRTLEVLARRLPSGVPHSYTSREILARVGMPAQARAALAELVSAVELCYFGRQASTRPDYERCREHFARFAREYVAGADPGGTPATAAAGSPEGRF
ncbi:MAG: DUF4129 domain-containing protein [Proteobacteria bacterium]|nr:DUF4129 domain-containing protein [Pseudomonadota bacterium]